MIPTAIFQAFPAAVDESKLAQALRESGMPCKVKRDGKSSLKIRPESDQIKPEAVRQFVAGFASGYMAF